MDACIFILTINSAMAVYANDRATQIDQLGAGDKVCVMEMDVGDWMKVHWSTGSAGHTGYLHEVAVKKPAIPTEPTPYEQSDAPPPPPPTPTPITPPNGPSPAPQNFPRNIDPDHVVRPMALVMQCFPLGGDAYGVVYVNGKAAVIGGGVTRPYPVIREHNDEQNHVFYITMQRRDQQRAVFAAFDYSRNGEDVSTLATQLPGKSKAKDKCVMDWIDTRY